MREIKFRGISKESGRFVYGNLIQTSKYKNGHIHCWIQEKSLLGLGAVSTPTSNFTEVIPKTVGQLIGLKDKNNGDIYEDDIVEWYQEGSNERKGVICWDDEYAGFEINMRAFAVEVSECMDFNHVLKIIGNTHQNLELLDN